MLRLCWKAMRGFPAKDFLRKNQRLQNQWGTAPKVLQLRVCPRKIPRELEHCPAAQCRHPRSCPEGTVFVHTAPRIFNSCSDYQNHEVHLGPTFPLSKGWGPTHTLNKVWGLTHTLRKLWELLQCCVDKLSAFSSVVWPIKSHTTTDWLW